MVKSPAKSKRMLFQRPDGSPYDFWIQSNSPQMTKDILSKQIEEHGGRVTEFGVFPEHGFLLLDAMDPSPLYEIKTTFHRPVQSTGKAYARTDTFNATPLRHVVSFRFVSAVIEKGEWNRYDLLRWGFPVSMTREDSVNQAAAVERYRKQIELGIDPEMEQGWIWATSRVFDKYDPNYRFTKEFEIVDEAIASMGPARNTKRHKTWLRGWVVAECRLKLQVKFYLHDDIKKEDQEALITAILENGGATCYDSTEADVILVGCEVDEVDDDVEVMDWITKNPRKAADSGLRTFVKFTPWVRRCIEARDYEIVGPKVEDVARAHRLLQKKKLTAKQKGKGRATLAEVNPPGKKRKRSSDENVMDGDEQGSPTKRRRQQQDETVGNSKFNSNSKSSRYLPSSLSLGTGTGTGSTVRPKRVFAGVAVLDHQSSPLKHDGSISSLLLGENSNSRQELTTIQPVEGREREDIIIAPAEAEHVSIILDPHQHSRVSATSILTVDTATSSKVGNTTTNTTTTGASKSARSVGPSIPANAQQVGRPSTSTRADTEPSAVSCDALDQSLELLPNKSSQRTRPIPDFPANFDADDLAGKVILDSLSDQPKDTSNLANRLTKASSAGKLLTEFEETLVLCWRQMSELEYKDGIVLIEDLVSGWPGLERELQQKAMASRGRKGKGRVSFHEPAIDEDQDQDFVLETDYDEDGAKRSGLKVASIKKPPNLGAYARDRHGSETPDSVVNSDEEGSVERELRPSRNASPTKPTAAGTTPGSPSLPKPSTLKKASNRNLSTAPRLSPRSLIKPASSSRAGLVDSTAAKDAQGNQEEEEEVVQDSEENERLAPLPLAKTRSQRRRADSVVSGNESAANESRPRRGRSASAAPSERVSGRAPTLPRIAAPAASGRRKYATKSTGGKPPPRKK